MNFADFELPQFIFVRHNWQIPLDKKTQEMIRSVYRNSYVILKFRLDQKRIVENLEYTCRHSVFLVQGDSKIRGPTVIGLFIKAVE